MENVWGWSGVDSGDATTSESFEDERTASPLEWGVAGYWRPGGVLDLWRMRGAQVVARARVRSDDPLAAGAIVALPLEGAAGELWARVLSCDPDREGGYRVTLGLLGQP